MNQRNETRLEISAPATLTLLDHPGREMNCQLVDVSGSGMQLVADEPLIVDEMVSLEVGPHLVLAGVRYCTPRGRKFTIGVERVHVVFATSLAEHENKAARILALVEDYHLQMTRVLNETTSAEHVGPVPEDPQPESVETASSPVVPTGGDSDAFRAAALGTIQDRSFTRPRMMSMVVGSVVGALTIGLLMFASPVKPKRLLPSVRAAGNHERESVRSKEAPQPLLLAGRETSKSESRSKTEERAGVARAGESASLIRNSAPPNVAAALGASVVQAAGSSRKRRLSLKLNGESWVSACVDGQKLFERALSSGDTREIEFSDNAVVRVGSAGDVEMALDGKSVGALGRPGQLRLLEVTSAGLRALPMRDPADDCAKGRVN